ncbi:GNAT family acetyltransferase [Fusarium heterosporum]|uniref:GNAT family acetyltransferase n=1 Tax=Fusarium heterosporum TaxID=42747 RepID=A0A8H5WC89_FUSHE|nr:GNAT family acetyltransferase [Fusarium heterosporum]
MTAISSHSNVPRLSFPRQSAPRFTARAARSLPTVAIVTTAAAFAEIAKNSSAMDPPFEVDGLTLSRANAEDVPAIKAIVTKAYTKYIDRIGKPPAPMTADYHVLITSHDVFVLKLPSTGDIVGSVVLKDDPGTNSVKINNLVVDTTVQGRGFGGFLMRYAEAFAKSRDRPALTLFTNAMMYENLTLYPKMGFMETERKSEDGYERVYFRKELS